MPSKMTREERAEYQREYRKRQRREQVVNTTMPAQAVRELIDCEDEVRRLKRELAARPVEKLPPGYNYDAQTGAKRLLDVTSRFGSPRPAPKPGAKKR